MSMLILITLRSGEVQDQTKPCEMLTLDPREVGVGSGHVGCQRKMRLPLERVLLDCHIFFLLEYYGSQILVFAMQ